MPRPGLCPEPRPCKPPALGASPAGSSRAAGVAPPPAPGGGSPRSAVGPSNDQLLSMPGAHGTGAPARGASRSFGAPGGTWGPARAPRAGGSPAAGSSGSTSGCRHRGHAPAGRATSLAWQLRQVACPQPNTAQSALVAKLSRHTAQSRGTPSCSRGGLRTGRGRTGAARGGGARSTPRPDSPGEGDWD